MSESSPPPSEPMWVALQRRKVVQWSLGYVAVAWGLLQGLEFAVGTFDWAAVITRLGAVVALFGLPVTIVLAWFHGDRGEQRASRVEIVILLGIVAAAGIVGQRVYVSTPSTAAASGVTAIHSRAGASTEQLALRRRLAVLPFANLGEDPANAAFVGGVHDTLITQIAKVPGLSVISRSSVMQFANAKPTIHDVAVALDVGTVLEGSVQRDGNKLRIQAQLIDAASDAHVWAETYDRPAQDLFAVQTEIAVAVAEQLRIRLTGGENDRLAANLTGDPRAYEHYVLGRNFVAKQDWPAAIRELTAAVTLDPNFAAAHAELSLSRTWLAFNEPTLRADLLPLARDGAERALTIDPTLPEGHLARAVYLYRGEPDIERAAQEFETAIAGLPNDVTAHLNFGFLRRWQGRLEDAAALFVHAAELDPGSFASQSAIQTLATLGRRDDALRLIESARRAQPDESIFAIWPALLAVDFDCDLGAAERIYDEVPAALRNQRDFLQERGWLALQTGDGPTAVAAAEALSRVAGPEDESIGWRRGLSLLAANRRSEGRAAIRGSLKSALRDAEVAGSSDGAATEWAWVAMHYGVLGERAQAEATVARAFSLLPESGASQARREIMTMTAVALAQAGATDAAIDRMQEVLAQPRTTKPSGYWCDPLLAPLRSNPRYRALMAEHGANVSIDPHDRRTWPE
jgi:TolB-like protein